MLYNCLVYIVLLHVTDRVSGSLGDINIPKEALNNNNADVYSPKFTIKADPPVTSASGQCTVKITIFGKGVHDTFVSPCPEDDLKLINIDDVMVLGDPRKNLLSFFSERPKTLVVVDNKVCTTKTYSYTSGVTISVRSPMSNVKCSLIKRRMSKILEDADEPIRIPEAVSSALPKSPVIKSTSQNPKLNSLNDDQPTVFYRPANDFVDSDRFTKTIKNYVPDVDGKRRRDIIITGRGLNECIEDYSGINVFPRTSTVRNIFVMKDRLGDFGLYTDTWGVSLMVFMGKCYKRNYETTEDQTKITTTRLTDSACSALKDKIDDVMRKKYTLNSVRKQVVVEYDE